MRAGGAAHFDAIVIGGGFAGLASATALAQADARVLLLEARPYLGGRARSWVDPDTGAVVDNGQHLFMGCYSETLAFLDRLGARSGLELQPRLSLPFVEPGGRVLTFRLPVLPPPWNILLGLLRFPGLNPGDRLRLLRVARAVGRSSRRGARASTRIPDDLSVAEWLAALGQSSRANERLWHPLAIASLNEEPDRASAAMLLPVLRGAFLTGEGSCLAIPRVGLSDLYVHPAAHYLRSRGSEVRLRAQVRQILIEKGLCAGVILADGARLDASGVVAAVPPTDLLELLPPEVAAEPFFARASRLESSPIVSVYLWFGSPVTEWPFAGLLGGSYQWCFNRGGHGLTLVRSAARAMVDLPRDVLVRAALDDLRLFIPGSKRATLRHSLVIKEKKATIAPVRGGMALRPSFRTPYRRLHLAGDWTATGLPATVEGAVLSGHAAARDFLDARRGS
jgi:hydroxysqualene dehydroxylase